MRKPRQDPVYIQSFGAVPVVRRNMREKYRLSLKPHIHAISWMDSPDRERRCSRRLACSIRARDRRCNGV